jgi:hypothetical protein
VTVIAEALGYRAPQFGVSAGDQHFHCRDLLVFNVEPKPEAWDLSVLRRQSSHMLLDSS